MTSRIIVCPKDIQLITGKSYKRSRLYLEKIKKELKKESHQVLTSIELSNYLGISLEEVQKVMF